MKDQDSLLLQRLRDPAHAVGHAESLLRISANALIYEAFDRSDMSCRELGERLGVSKARAHRIVGDNSVNFTISLLGRVAGAMGLRWRIALEDVITGQLRHDFPLPAVDDSGPSNEEEIAREFDILADSLKRQVPVGGGKLRLLASGPRNGPKWGPTPTVGITQKRAAVE